MVVVGIDVLIITAVGLLCNLGVVTFCTPERMTKREGDAAIAASMFTSIAMTIGYVLMAKVLDAVIGIYW